MYASNGSESVESFSGDCADPPLALPRTPGRLAKVIVDGDLEVHFAARPTSGPQVPHPRDELYVIASGTDRYRVEDQLIDVGPGDPRWFPVGQHPNG